jgi:hypothetical protein
VRVLSVSVWEPRTHALLLVAEFRECVESRQTIRRLAALIEIMLEKIHALHS